MPLADDDTVSKRSSPPIAELIDRVRYTGFLIGYRIKHAMITEVNNNCPDCVVLD
jgi:hypothetical protein